MTLSVAQNAIALLIDLAERGEIDPWNVKVIEVIDRVLAEVVRSDRAQKMDRASYEADLSESGQAFLYASMLVLLKADSLARLESPDEAEEEIIDPELDVAGDGLLEPQLPLRLENHIRRRTSASPPERRQVTLQELIAQLELMATAMEAQPERPRTRRPRPQSRAQAVRTIAQLAHQENLSETAAVLEDFLFQRWPELSQGAEWIDFEVLLHHWQQQQPPSNTDNLHTANPNHDRVGIFWALLLLASQSKAELHQDEFYGVLKVRPYAEAIAETPPPDWGVRVVPD